MAAEGVPDAVVRIVDFALDAARSTNNAGVGLDLLRAWSRDHPGHDYDIEVQLGAVRDARGSASAMARAIAENW